MQKSVVRGRQIEQERERERERENIRKKVPIMLIKKPKLKTENQMKKLFRI